MPPRCGATEQLTAHTHAAMATAAAAVSATKSIFEHVMQYLHYNQINEWPLPISLTWTTKSVTIFSRFALSLVLSGWDKTIYRVDSSTVLKFERIANKKMCVRWWMFKIQHDKLCAKIEKKNIFFFATTRFSSHNLYVVFMHLHKHTHSHSYIWLFDSEPRGRFTLWALACLFCVQQKNTHKLCHTRLNYNVNCIQKRERKKHHRRNKIYIA